MESVRNLESVAKAFCGERALVFSGSVGEGAFKQTFKVTEEASGRALALKVYKQAASDERSVREVEAMQRCDHCNIAKLHSISPYSTAEGTFTIILEEYLGGGTLEERSPISAAECLRIGAQLISAVAHCAELRLVHRDLKPANILFREDTRTPVIVDFGLVRDLADTSITPSWAMRGPGTPFFASPEQLNNDKQQIDWRTDQFSLGVVLALVTFGFHPYGGRDVIPTEIVSRVASRQQPVAEFRTAVASARLNALPRMVAPWPVQRFRTAEMLADAWETQGGARNGESRF